MILFLLAARFSWTMDHILPAYIPYWKHRPTLKNVGFCPPILIFFTSLRVLHHIKFWRWKNQSLARPLDIVPHTIHWDMCVFLGCDAIHPPPFNPEKKIIKNNQQWKDQHLRDCMFHITTSTMLHCILSTIVWCVIINRPYVFIPFASCKSGAHNYQTASHSGGATWCAMR